MSDGDLQLTTFFGERDRGPARLLADELLDLYEHHGIDRSVLLRGAEGFGLRHHLRTDRLLTLSEDLPLVSIATDRADRIEAVLAPVLALKRKGLITMEPTHMIDAASGLPSSDDVKLSIVVGRAERADGHSAIATACALLHAHEVAGATALIGVDGTRDATRTRARFFATNTHVPAMILAVGSGQPIAEVLPELQRTLPSATFSVRASTILKRDGGTLAELPTIADEQPSGNLETWLRLTVYTSEAALIDGRPTGERIIRGLREAGLTGATTLRGIWGYHGDHAPHGDRLVQLRRHVPTVVTTIDTMQRIRRAYEVIDELTPERGLVTCETVPALLTFDDGRRHGGLRLAHGT